MQMIIIMQTELEFCKDKSGRNNNFRHLDIQKQTIRWSALSIPTNTNAHSKQIGRKASNAIRRAEDSTNLRAKAHMKKVDATKKHKTVCSLIGGRPSVSRFSDFPREAGNSGFM